MAVGAVDRNQAVADFSNGGVNTNGGKIDLVAPEERTSLVAEFRRRMRTKAPVYAISAATGEGCRELAADIARFLETRRKSVEEAAADAASSPSELE